MTILLSDPLVSAVPVRDCGDPLVPLDLSSGLVLDPPATRGALVRAGLATRLSLAQAALPAGLRLHVVEGHRPVHAQRAIIASYGAQVRRAHPRAGTAELHRLTSRFVAPLEVAPHVAGAAVDLTLVDADGRELDLGTHIDATPEESGGACYFAAPVSARARAHRDLLARVLEGAGLVNYPTEWWHWSYGDRYWALVTGAPHALYGPVDAEVAA
ncbi:M15 family metallopeptidase [Nocardioides pacificus]